MSSKQAQAIPNLINKAVIAIVMKLNRGKARKANGTEAEGSIRFPRSRKAVGQVPSLQTCYSKCLCRVAAATLSVCPIDYENFSGNHPSICTQMLTEDTMAGVSVLQKELWLTLSL